MKKGKTTLILFLLLIMILVQSSSSPVVAKTNQPIASVKGINYVDRVPIEILNNSAFGTAGYDFPGSGTSSDPYLIDDYNITTSTENLITIENTDMFFKISNCYLNASSGSVYCITMDNVTNGIIDSNLIYNSSSVGINQDDSHNNIFLNNTIYGCELGIGSYGSANDTFSDNTIYECRGPSFQSGMYIVNCKNETVLYNKVHDAVVNGIILQSSTNCTISSNIIYNCSGIGLINTAIINNTFSDNIVSYCGWGFMFMGPDGGPITGPCRNNTIYRNNIYNCSGTAISFSSSDVDYNIVSYNTIYNNSGYGFTIDPSDTYNRLNNNNFITNFGVTAQASDAGTNNNINSNYWSDYTGSGNYTVEGTPRNNDTSPLLNPASQLFINTPLATTYAVNTISVALLGNALNYMYYIEGVDNQNITWTKNEDRTLIDGAYTLHAYGTIMTSTTHISVAFTIDASTIAVDITSPTNTTYKQNSVTLTYTSSGGAITVYIDGVANTSARPSGSVISGLLDGSHNITIVAADVIGNMAKDTVIFTTDTTTTTKTTSFAGLFTILLSIAMLLVAKRRRKKV